MRYYVFIGEEPSKTAILKGWVWGDDHLCSKTLINALNACFIKRESYEFRNLFRNQMVNQDVINELMELKNIEDLSIVGMGKNVQRVLDNLNIPHLKLIHPAARGKIRKTVLYIQHVNQVLLGKPAYDLEI